MSAVKLIAVFSENKPGYAARITKAIGDAKINIRWVTIAGIGGFGVMKLLVDKQEEALACLKQKGVTVNTLEALAVEVKDQPGALNTICETLAKGGINLENTSGFVANHRAILVIETHDIEGAAAVLQKHGHRLLTQQEILSL
jgi:hypothetical protein